MNKGVLHSSAVQQIMAAGNPNWWAIPAPSSHHNSSSSPPLPTHPNGVNLLPPQTHHSFPFSPPSWPLNNYIHINDNSTNQDQTTPDPWSQQQHLLFMNGQVAKEERVINHGFPENYQYQKEQLVKQEKSKSSEFVDGNNELMDGSNTVTATSSPQSSCITTFSGTNFMEFSSASNQPLLAPATAHPRSECSSSAANDGAVKKTKVQSLATQSTFKVRKFGDRITALHQLVSPFGKTDTASVLLESIGYIRFLQSQIQVLSKPYLSNGSGNKKRQQRSAQGERNSSIFPEDPGQEEPKEDLRSRGLCLVPVSCTMDVGRENGAADYWAPSFGDRFPVD